MRIVPNPTFTTEVKLTTPGQGPEGCARINITWRHKTHDDLNEWRQQGLQELNLSTPQAERRSHATHMAKVIEAWDGPVDVDGKPVPFSADALYEVMLHRPRAADELLLQYLSAYAESRLKN